MGERMVTTIGGLDIFTGTFAEGVAKLRRTELRSMLQSGKPTPRRRRRRNRFPFIGDGDLNEMMGMGSLDDSGKPIPLDAAIAIPDKKKKVVGNPAPAKPSKEAWKLGQHRYILQRGDTMFGLGTTYLGAGVRWPEIWKIQSPTFKSKNTPDKIKEGDLIVMPSEAESRARSMGLLPGVLGLSPMKAALAGVGVLAAGGAAYYFGSNS